MCNTIGSARMAWPTRWWEVCADRISYIIMTIAAVRDLYPVPSCGRNLHRPHYYHYTFVIICSVRIVSSSITNTHTLPSKKRHDIPTTAVLNIDDDVECIIIIVLYRQCIIIILCAYNIIMCEYTIPWRLKNNSIWYNLCIGFTATCTYSFFSINIERNNYNTFNIFNVKP